MHDVCMSLSVYTMELICYGTVAVKVCVSDVSVLTIVTEFCNECSQYKL